MEAIEGTGTRSARPTETNYQESILPLRPLSATPVATWSFGTHTNSAWISMRLVFAGFRKADHEDAPATPSASCFKRTIWRRRANSRVSGSSPRTDCSGRVHPLGPPSSFNTSGGPRSPSMVAGPQDSKNRPDEKHPPARQARTGFHVQSGRSAARMLASRGFFRPWCDPAAGASDQSGDTR